MHILEIPSFYPPYGGLFCLDQAKALKALGHEVRILSNVQLGISIGAKDFLTLPFGRYEHQQEGVEIFQSYQRGIPKVIRFNVNRWVSIVCSMFKDYVARYGKPDILHSHCAKWAGYSAMLISRDYQIPYVITEHLPLMLLEEEYGPAPSTSWQVPLLKEAYEHADMVIAVSEELVDDIACYYGRNYRWQYVSNTIDTDFFACRQRESQAGRPYRFCCLADYSYRKGYDVLFEAYRRVSARGMAVELHIAGLQTDGKECRSEIDRLQLQNITAYGRISKAEVRDLLYRSDALVLASRSEVQPLVVLEAMSTGIPVVATECVPSCQCLPGCSIVAIGDAEALADAMLSQVEQGEADGKMLSETVRALASPQVVGRKLSGIFSEIIVSR